MRNLNNAIILLDKPVGITSYDVIRSFKRMFAVKKIGHSGTLDKFASGLLVICTGQATKLTNYFLQDSKRYTATVKLGIATDSCDKDGTIVRETGTGHLTDDDIVRTCQKFIGDQEQLPPLFSALKVNGKRASDLIRQGKNVNLKSRKISIFDLTIIRYDLLQSEFTIDVSCSKGTYIRALARDIGDDLGVGAHLTALRRTQSGNFEIKNAVTMNELADYKDNGIALKQFVVDPNNAFPHYGFIIVSEKTKQKVLKGQRIGQDDVLEHEARQGNIYKILTDEKKLIAIAQVELDKWHVKYLNVFTMLNNK